MTFLASRLAPFLAAALVAGNAVAQTTAPGTTTTAAWAGMTQVFKADVDGGGDADRTVFFAGVNIGHQFTPVLNVGLTLRYSYEDWSFGDPVAFGGVAPWNRIHRPGIALPTTWAFDADTRLIINPQIEWAYESGASSSDAKNYGAIVAVSKRFSRDLTLGLGVGVFDEIDDTQVIPIILVDWRFAPGWRLGNALPAGPAGGAGVEVSFEPNERWELGVAAAFRNYRYRLDRDGPTPNGIGEHREIPVVFRATWKPDRRTSVDLFAGVALDGRLRVNDENDNRLVTQDIDPAALLGVVVRARF